LPQRGALLIRGQSCLLAKVGGLQAQNLHSAFAIRRIEAEFLAPLLQLAFECPPAEVLRCPGLRAEDRSQALLDYPGLKELVVLEGSGMGELLEDSLQAGCVQWFMRHECAVSRKDLDGRWKQVYHPRA